MAMQKGMNLRCLLFEKNGREMDRLSQTPNARIVWDGSIPVCGYVIEKDRMHNFKVVEAGFNPELITRNKAEALLRENFAVS